MRLGIVSDTHGSLPPSVHTALAGVDRIIHAGDIGGQRILDELEAIAPVTAVRGNMDTGELDWRLQDSVVLRLGDVRVIVAHEVRSLSAKGIPEGVGVVVSGHTHRAAVERVGDVLFVNPGSTGGHNRDRRGPTAAIVDLGATPPSARIIDLS